MAKTLLDEIIRVVKKTTSQLKKIVSRKPAVRRTKRRRRR